MSMMSLSTILKENPGKSQMIPESTAELSNMAMISLTTIMEIINSKAKVLMRTK